MGSRSQEFSCFLGKTGGFVEEWVETEFLLKTHFFHQNPSKFKITAQLQPQPGRFQNFSPDDPDVPKSGLNVKDKFASAAPPAAERGTTAPRMPINPHSAVTFATMREHIKRLEAFVDAQGMGITQLMATAVNDAAEHLAALEAASYRAAALGPEGKVLDEAGHDSRMNEKVARLEADNKRLNAINDDLMKENDALRAAVEKGAAALERASFETDSEDNERLHADEDQREGPVEDGELKPQPIEDIETGLAQPQGNVEEESTTPLGTTKDGASRHRQVIKSDKDLDREELMSLANIIKNEPQDYSEEEKEAIRKGKEFYMKCKASKKFKDVKSPDPEVKMKLVHLEGESQAIGMCEAIVDTSLEECVAYEFIKDSREKLFKLGKKYKAIKTKRLNGHSQLYLNSRNLGRGLSEREWRAYCC